MTVTVPIESRPAWAIAAPRTGFFERSTTKAGPKLNSSSRISQSTATDATTSPPTANG